MNNNIWIPDILGSETLNKAEYNTTTKNLELHYKNELTQEQRTISIDISSLCSYESLEEQIKNSDNNNLDKIFNLVCDEYGRRLCAKYDWDFNDCFWVADLRAGTFCTSDIEYSLSLEDVKLLVDNDVPYSEFVKWWEYNYRMSMAIRNNPNDKSLHEVNLWTWIKGYHGDKDKEWLKKQEDLYWSKTYEEEFEDKHTQLSFTEDFKKNLDENNINIKENE